MSPGKNVEVHEGTRYIEDLKKLGIDKLQEAITDRRLNGPVEGVEIKPLLWVDQVTIPGHKVPFRYLFSRIRNDVFLYRVKSGQFTEKELIYFAELAEKFTK